MASFVLGAFRNLYYGRQEATPIPSFLDPTVTRKTKKTLKPSSAISLADAFAAEPTGIWCNEDDDLPDI
jgi:hypothetical protein